MRGCLALQHDLVRAAMFTCMLPHGRVCVLFSCNGYNIPGCLVINLAAHCGIPPPFPCHPCHGQARTLEQDEITQASAMMQTGLESTCG